MSSMVVLEIMHSLNRDCLYEHEINDDFHFHRCFSCAHWVSLVASFPAEAETIDCLELAQQFANNAINFDESLECRSGEL